MPKIELSPQAVNNLILEGHTVKQYAHGAQAFRAPRTDRIIFVENGRFYEVTRTTPYEDSNMCMYLLNDNGLVDCFEVEEVTTTITIYQRIQDKDEKTI